LEFIATVEQEAGSIAACPLALNRGLEASITAHHLYLGDCSRNIFGMGFQLRMGVSKVQERNALAALILSGRLARGLIGDQGADADRRCAAQ
jgi:hypothetical protein